MSKIIKFKKKSNIFYSYHLGNFLAFLEFSQKNLLLYNEYFYTRYLWFISKALVLSGILSAAMLVKQRGVNKSLVFIKNSIKKKCDRVAIKIFFKYFMENPIFFSIYLYSSPGRYLYISAVKLQKLVSINPGIMFFISTAQYGFITGVRAAELNIGGILMFKVV